MQAEVTSKHLRGTAELMLLVPIKPGFVQARELVTYATRLRRLLNALFEANRSVAEHDLCEGAGPIPRLRSIFTTQWAVLDDLAAPRLFVSACFDRPWEDYVELLVDKTGPLLDAIFCHCVGYENLTCADGFEAFATWLRKHQVPCDFFYAATPDLTVDDLRYQRKLTAAAARGEHPASVVIGSPEFEAKLAIAPPGSAEGGPRRLLSLIGDLFPDIREFADSSERTARRILLEAAASFEARDPTLRKSKTVKLSPSDLASIQGNILRSYRGMTHGAALLLQCDDAAGLLALLGLLGDRISSEADTDTEGPRLNLALTYDALTRLDLGEDILACFPKEFREGMEARCGLLGDVGIHHHPDFWQEPKINWPDCTGRNKGAPDRGQRIRLSTVDVVLMIQGRFASAPASDYAWTENHPLHAVVKSLHLELLSGVRLLHVQPLRRVFEQAGYREHFGFLDSGDGRSGSQPVPNVEALVDGAAERDRLALGELLLGYENRKGVSATCADYVHNPGSAALFRNGTFMVLRKLRQHVGRFNEFAERSAAKLRDAGSSVDADWIKGRIVGRNIKTGEPLFRSRPQAGCSEPPSNDFTFEGDEGGLGCPLHAHIRRANPRALDDIPRVVRRGFSYGPPYSREANDAVDRGLFFMAYNTSIAEQFEVVQRWLNGGNSTGLSSAQNDLFTGFLPRGAARWLHNDGEPHLLAEPTEPLVTLSWGSYLFVPSKKAIEWLVERGRSSRTHAFSAELARKGAVLLERLDALAEDDEARARQAWKRVLEEPESRPEAAAAWAAIAATPRKLKRTPYGLLVASAAGAEAVLADSGERFSVREYWPRLRDTMGEHYLSFDRSPAKLQCPHSAERDLAYEVRMAELSYTLFSCEPNEFIKTLVDDAYVQGLAYARGFFAKLSSASGATPPASFDVRALAMVVVGQLAHAWLGTPLPADCSAEALASFLEHFIVISQYAFQPYPEPWLAAEARARGQKLREAYRRGPMTGAMVSALRKRELDEDSICQAVIGAIVGFAAPAVASIATVLASSIQSGDLWRARQTCAGLDDDACLQALRAPLLSALQRTPIPPILYRTAVAATELSGEVTQPGELVVVGLQAAVADAARTKPSKAWYWLFGGAHGDVAGDGKPPHGCPARTAAIDAMVGVITAVVKLRDLTALGPTELAFRSNGEDAG